MKNPARTFISNFVRRLPSPQHCLTLLLLLSFAIPSKAEPSVEEGEITARELAKNLGIENKKLNFKFDSPVYTKFELVVVGGEEHGTSLVADKPQKEISFYYISKKQPVASRMDTGIMLEMSLEGAGGTTYGFRDPTAMPNMGIYPPVKLPAIPDPTKPVYIFLWWNSSEHTFDFSHDTPADVAAQIKHGYYLALYFSLTPFEQVSLTH